MEGPTIMIRGGLKTALEVLEDAKKVIGGTIQVPKHDRSLKTTLLLQLTTSLPAWRSIITVKKTTRFADHIPTMLRNKVAPLCP